MLTLSLVMIPWDWIGIVTIRNDTRLMHWTNGTMKISPGPRAPPVTFPSLKHDCALVLRTLVGEVAGGRVDQRTSQTGRPLVRGN
jgi:hypothetical protein